MSDVQIDSAVVPGRSMLMGRPIAVGGFRYRAAIARFENV